MAPASEVRPSGTLGAFIAGPLLALGIVFFAASLLPGADCDPLSDSGSSLPRARLILATVLASLATGGAALWRLRELHGSRPLAGPGALVLCGFVVFVVLTEALFPQVRALVWIALTAGVLSTGALLVMLLGAWLSGRHADQVGILLPAYLLGASLCCYPFLAMFALAVNNGAFC